MSILGIWNPNGKGLVITYCQCNNCEVENCSQCRPEILLPTRENQILLVRKELLYILTHQYSPDFVPGSTFSQDDPENGKTRYVYDSTRIDADKGGAADDVLLVGENNDTSGDSIQELHGKQCISFIAHANTVAWAESVWSVKGGRLRLVSEYHNALEDAIACGNVLLSALSAKGVTTIKEFAALVGMRLGKLYAGGYNPCQHSEANI